MTSEIDLTKNHIWVTRMGGYFDSMDLNRNGLLSINEFYKYADNLEKTCHATSKEIKALRDCIQLFWGVVGLVPGVELDKKQFLKGVNRLAKAELKRDAENRPTLHSKQNNAFFHVIDIDNDGTLTLNEVQVLMKACNYDAKAAEAWFNAADANKNGRIEREELNKVEFDFWFRPEDPASKGTFGGLFE